MAAHSRFSQSVAVINLNNGIQTGNGTIRQVLVTPVVTRDRANATGVPAPQAAIVTHWPPKVFPIDKVFLKAVSKENSKEAKTFTLRNIDTAQVSNSDDLKELIKEKLGDDVKDCDYFDVGYIQRPGDRVIMIRTEEDLADVWREMRTPNSKIQLWCDGLRSSGTTKNTRKWRRKEQSDSESETDSQPKKHTKKKKSAQQEREERVEESLDALKKEYGADYTQMQYLIWAECIANGMGTLDNAPNTSMFKRAGGSSKKVDTKPSNAASLSPAKIIENRSKCYWQLSELRNLKDEGLISDEDYDHERGAIMGMLKKFQAIWLGFTLNLHACMTVMVYANSYMYPQCRAYDIQSCSVTISNVMLNNTLGVLLDWNSLSFSLMMALTLLNMFSTGLRSGE